MIKRELYMSRIRPFIGNELIKVMTGIRRSGKSVMLELIKEELRASGVFDEQFISYNFEDIRHASLCTAVALHDEIEKQVSAIKGKVYFFFDELQHNRLSAAAHAGYNLNKLISDKRTDAAHV